MYVCLCVFLFPKYYLGCMVSNECLIFYLCTLILFYFTPTPLFYVETLLIALHQCSCINIIQSNNLNLHLKVIFFECYFSHPMAFSCALQKFQKYPWSGLCFPDQIVSNFRNIKSGQIRSV
jgi:hypothetical protein